MNTTDSPTGGAPDDPQPSRGQRPADGFFGWIRGLGFARAQDRWFAGVASGIAAKIGLDPLIVRGIFVVLAVLGGPGILLYLVGWLLMPDHTGRIHLEDIVRGRASTGVLITAIIVAAVVVLPVLMRLIGLPFGGFAFWNLWGMPEWISTLFAVLWWTALVGGAIWLLVWFFSRGPGSRPSQGPPGGPGDVPGEPPRAAAEERGASQTGEPAAPQAEGHGGKPTDGKGRDRNAADRSSEWGEDVGKRASEWGNRVAEEAAARHEARRLGPGHVLLTLALALLAGGVVAVSLLGGWLIDPQTSAAESTRLALVGGSVAALVVVGLSLILAGVRGRDGGWVTFFSWCGIVALLFTAVFPSGSTFQPFGTYTSSVTGEAHEPRGVTMLAGNSVVDLTPLDDGAGPADYEAWLFAGNARVQLPEDHPVIVEVRVLAGNVGEYGTEDDGRRVSGPFLSRTVTANVPRGASDEDITRVTVYVGFGNVRVNGDGARGDDASRPAERSGIDDDLAGLETELDDLSEELDRVEWQLSEPGLDSRERGRLTDERQRITDDIDRVEDDIDRTEAEMKR